MADTKDTTVPTPATPAVELPKKAVSTTVSGEKFEVLRELKFINRLDTTGELVALALDEFIENHPLPTK